ncbi:relaxation protein [uncultured Stenotrophomonas sp.]|uniref:relaxation protein n=1 Tax=uncultured Stenotrophomonas sp. TaxID=165438 RepID=UPI0025DF9C43|nr:relaxation protein [uncultured Stenotrophomonas sp.]
MNPPAVNEHDLDALVARTALLMAQFQRMQADLEQQQSQAIASLEQLSRILPVQLRSSADAALGAVGREGAAMVQGALQQPLKAYETQLAQSATRLADSAQTLAGSIDQQRRVARSVAWKSVASAVAAVSLVLGGGAWLGTRYRADLERDRIQAELMRAYNQADVVLCGKPQRLCANVDSKGPAYGEGRRYRPVRPRP